MRCVCALELSRYNDANTADRYTCRRLDASGAAPGRAYRLPTRRYPEAGIPGGPGRRAVRATPAKGCDYTFAPSERAFRPFRTSYERTTRGISGCRTSACQCWVSLRVTQKVPPRQLLEREEIYCRGKILPGTIFSSLLISITYAALFLGLRDPTCHSRYRGFVRSVRKPLRCQPNLKSLLLSKFGPFVSSVGNFRIAFLHLGLHPRRPV